jgi:hypothetical protein
MQTERATFIDWSTGSDSSGVQYFCSGEFVVYVHEIPEDAPQDWPMGVKQTPGTFGAYREHLFYPAKHGPYAFAVGKTMEEAKSAATGCFKRPKVNLEPDKKRPARALWETVL